MQINNPFESGHIKNYVLLYVSVVVIMVLFFFASTLFNDVQTVEKKVFNAEVSKELQDERNKEVLEDNEDKPSLKSKLKLMDRSY